jgi:hypothetical protein
MRPSTRWPGWSSSLHLGKLREFFSRPHGEVPTAIAEFPAVRRGDGETESVGLAAALLDLCKQIHTH